MANLLRRDRVLLEAAIASPRHSSPRCAASTLALKRVRLFADKFFAMQLL